MAEIITQQPASTTAPIDGKDAPVADVAAPPEEKKADFLSPKFAALAKQTKENHRIQQEIKAEREAMKAEREAMKREFIPREQLTKEPVQTLLDAGFTADQLTMLGIAVPNAQDQKFRELEAKLKAMEDLTRASETKHQESQKQEYDRALENIRKQATRLVESDENYETIKAMGATENVVELIKDKFEEDGTLLSVEEAAQQIEDNLLEEAVKFAGLKKVKAKLTPVVAEPEVKKSLAHAIIQKSASTPQTNQIKTLTNAQSASSSRRRNEAERRQYVIDLIEGRVQK